MKVVLSAGALADLQGIGDYIAKDNLGAAESFVARLKSRCFDLGTFPNVGTKRDDIRAGYRSIAEGNYVIYYRVRPEVVEIMHVLHGAQDAKKVIEQE